MIKKGDKVKHKNANDFAKYGIMEVLDVKGGIVICTDKSRTNPFSFDIKDLQIV